MADSATRAVHASGLNLYQPMIWQELPAISAEDAINDSLERDLIGDSDSVAQDSTTRYFSK